MGAAERGTDGSLNLQVRRGGWPQCTHMHVQCTAPHVHLPCHSLLPGCPRRCLHARWHSPAPRQRHPRLPSRALQYITADSTATSFRTLSPDGKTLRIAYLQSVEVGAALRCAVL